MLKIKKSIITLFLFISCSFLLCEVEFTEKESEYLAYKNSFTILISNNNYPYEYIDDFGNPSGINVMYITEILKFTNSKLIFTTNIDENEPDIVSSFVNHDLKYSFHTDTIFESDIYFMYKDAITPYNASYIVTINQEYILNKLMEKYEYQKHILSENNFKSNFFIDYHKDIILAFDNFSKIFLVNNTKTDTIIERQKDLKIEFYLCIKNTNPILFNILSKSIQSQQERNLFYKNFKIFVKQSQNYYTYKKYEKTVKITLIIVFVFFLVSLFLFLKYRVYRFHLQKLLVSYNTENQSLKQRIESLTHQIELIRSDSNHLEKINGLALILDLKGNIQFVNDYCKTLLGFAQDELLNHNIIKIVSKDNKQKLLNLSNVENYLRNFQVIPEFEKQNPFEIEVLAKDGLKKSFIFTTYFTKSYEGNTEINCILLNISDRKILQNRLDAMNSNLDDMIRQRTKVIKESEEKFRFVFDKAYNGVFVIKNNLFTLVNDALSVLTGYPIDSFTEKLLKFQDIIDNAECENVMEKIATNVENKVDYFYLQTKLKNNVGYLVDVEIHFTTTHQENELIILGVIHDISFKKEYEDKKLQAAKLNTLSEFSITANDKINSPLNAIYGYVELLELTNKAPTPAQEKAFSNIYESINIIKKILHRLKTLTKITQQKYNFADLKMIDVNQDITDEKEDNKNE